MGAGLVIELVLGLLDRATKLTELFNLARKEGRDISMTELNSILAEDDKARSDLAAAIERARNAEANKKAAAKKEG